MDFTFSKEDEAFRHEVIAFLKAELTPEIIRARAETPTLFVSVDVARAWHKKLNNKGWLAPLWPKEYGGAELSPVQYYILNQECERAGAPATIPMGLKYVGPVIIKYGTQKQKDFYLPRILSGEDYWCQGFSETCAGSDLTALQLRAEKDPISGDYLVNGSKMWTTHGSEANMIFCLVRTKETQKPSKGISFLLIDMHSNGVSVSPIESLTGDNELNQIFFDNVRVPAENLVGEENRGWECARFLLEFERGNGAAACLEKALARVKSVVASHQEFWGGSSSGAEKGLLIQKIARVDIKLQALDYTERRVLAGLSAGKSPGNEASLLKLLATDLEQEISLLSREAIGPKALLSSAIAVPGWVPTINKAYFNKRAASIYGGSNEVQKNIIARRVLGL